MGRAPITLLNHSLPPCPYTRDVQRLGHWGGISGRPTWDPGQTCGFKGPGKIVLDFGGADHWSLAGSHVLTETMHTPDTTKTEFMYSDGAGTYYGKKK